MQYYNTNAYDLKDISDKFRFEMSHLPFNDSNDKKGFIFYSYIFLFFVSGTEFLGSVSVSELRLSVSYSLSV